MSTSRSRWSAIIAEHTLSELSVARFCARRGISTAAFYRWRRALQDGGPSRRRRRRTAAGSPVFLEAVVADPVPASTPGASAPASPIIEIGSGRRIVVPCGFDEETLARLVQALERLDASAQEARP